MNAYIYQNKKGDIKVAVTPDEQMRYDWKGYKLIEKINVKTFVEAHYGLKEKLLSNAYNMENQAGDIDYVIDVEDIHKIFGSIGKTENCQCKNSTFTRRKVYITYEKDGYGGTQVDRVFLNESDVRLYVTTEIIANNSKTPEELAKRQEEQYEVHEIIESL